MYRFKVKGGIRKCPCKVEVEVDRKLRAGAVFF